MLEFIFYFFIIPIGVIFLIAIIAERNDHKKVELLLKERLINERKILRKEGNMTELLLKRDRIERALEHCEHEERFSHIKGEISDSKYLEYRKKNWMMCDVDRINVNK
jgi:hypothetical protein